jgi:long-chain fatty acid transport protein
MKRISLTILGAGFGLALSSSAGAAGFATARFGGEHGNPTTDNPTAIYYNPSGIALLPGINIFADGNIAYRLSSFTHNPPTSGPQDVPEPADAQGINNGEGTLTNIVAAPMLGLTLGIPLSDSVDLALGAGFFVPFGGTAVWDQNDAFENSAYPGGLDGTQRWYSIHGTIRTIYISGAAAIGISDIVSIGLSLGVAQSTIDSLRARNSNGDNNVVNEGRAWLDAEKINFQMGGGIMITPLDGALRIGASYQAPPGLGEQALEGTLAKQLGNPTANTVSGRDQAVEVHQHMPDIFRLGVQYRFSNPDRTPFAEVRASGDYQRWSLFQDQCIAPAGTPCEVNEDGSDGEGTTAVANLPRRWQDAGSVRVGGSYWVVPEVELFGGVGYDSNAIPDENLDPALMDFHDVSIGVGAKLKPIDMLAIAVSYTHFIYIPRDTTDKSVNDDFAGQSKGPDAGGEYTQTIGALNVNLQLHFDPFSPDDDEAEEAKGPAASAVH